jgi:hypothetical protein
MTVCLMPALLKRDLVPFFAGTILHGHLLIGNKSAHPLMVRSVARSIKAVKLGA